MSPLTPRQLRHAAAIRRLAAKAAKAKAKAKGCHGCRFSFDLTCSASFSTAVQAWQSQHLSPDLMTPKDGAPECPVRPQR